jgi:hypothetical protein
MRGLWDNEKPLPPALLRSSLALVGGFLGLCAVVMLIISVANVAGGNYVPAAMQLAAGVALPFGIWLALRMLADMLITMHRSHDRLAAIEEALSGKAAHVPAPGPVFQTNGPVTSRAAGRAGDDGPAYPAEE